MGGMRSAAQIVSYEVPAVLTVLSVALLAGSLQLGDIVTAQPHVGYVLLQPVGFILFLIASNAEINRAPFDLPESDSELVSGFVTEYSAMRFAFFFLAEYTNLFLAGAFAATLFLGRMARPVPPAGGLVPPEELHRGLHPDLDPLDVPPAARGPPHGVLLEGPAPAGAG